MIACGILELATRSFNAGLQRRGNRDRVVSIAMKRLIVVLSCISIFYAGGVWALEGCLDLGAEVHRAHNSENSSDEHDNPAPAQHSHTDPLQIHCPNFLSEFLISLPLSLSSGSARMHHAVHDTATINGLPRSIRLNEGNGPPGPLYSKTIPRHLLLSVIRI